MTGCNRIVCGVSYGNTLMILIKKNFVMVFLDLRKGRVVF